MEKISLQTPGKVNLYLNVSGKDNRGYHYIETLFQTISIFDNIEIIREKREEHQLNITGKYGNLLGESKNNLIFKAVELFFMETELKREGLTFNLEKNIPVSAGLGGGSSDAAATLIGLEQLFKTGISNKALYDLGAELGSDVNFFLEGGTSLGFGRGEKLEQISLALPGYFVVLYPNFEISAKFAYKNLQKKLLTKQENNIIIINLLKNINKTKLFEIAKNDLQEFLLVKYPLLEDLINLLSDSGAEFSLVSGSGSCVFGYFETCPDITALPVDQNIDSFLAQKCWGVAKR